jgi:hypothetical protein
MTYDSRHEYPGSPDRPPAWEGWNTPASAQDPRYDEAGYPVPPPAGHPLSHRREPQPQPWEQPPPYQHDPRGGWQQPPSYQRDPRTGWQQPAPVVAPDPPQPPPQSAEEAKDWIRVRVEVSRAIRLLSVEHAVDAYASLSGSKWLSPHAVSLFYAPYDPRPAGGLRVYTVSRWSWDEPLTRDLPRFLDGLAGVATKFAADAPPGHRWDPRGPDKPLINKGDRDMPQDRTVFVGLGVTTLDTASDDWFDWAPPFRERNPYKQMFGPDLPGEAVALIRDGSVLRLNRDGQLELGYDGISCSHSLDPNRPGLSSSYDGKTVTDYLGPRLEQALPHITEFNKVLLNQYAAA